MKLVLPITLVKRLKIAVRRGRRREIGGVLVGQYLGNETFRVADLSVQTNGGTSVHFVRDPEYHRAFLAEFFARTGKDYERFNYLGEWHSHPGFAPLPSGEDFGTMFDIVHNPDVGVNFAVLVIARTRSWNRIELSATAFRKGATTPEPVEVEIEHDDEKIESRVQRILSFIRR